MLRTFYLTTLYKKISRQFTPLNKANEPTAISLKTGLLYHIVFLVARHFCWRKGVL